MIRTLTLALLLLASPAAAQQRAEVIDGDTLRVSGRTVRIIGIDTPEMRGACQREVRLARQARDRMAVLIRHGVVLELRGNDRYRRQLAVVRDRQGRDLARIMIAEGHARPYDGRGRRQGWC